MNKKIIYRNKKVSVVQFYVINVGKKLIGCVYMYGLTLGSVDKGSACNAGDTGSIPVLGRSSGGGMATHSSILAWRIPWTEKPGRL